MNVGVVTHAYYPRFGGVTEHVAALAREMRRRGHEVTIITGHFPDEDADEANVVRVSRTWLVPHNGAFCDFTLGPGLPRRLAVTLRRSRFDVLHVHEPYAPVLGLLAVFLARCPVVGTFHAAAPSNRAYALFASPLRRVATRLAARIAVSSAARALVARYVPAEYEVIPNGVDTRRFAPGLEPAAALAGDGPLVLFVGRLDPRKGVDVLLEAMARLGRTVPGVRLVVAGDGPLRRPLERRARLLLGGAARFHGAVPPADLPAFYAAADVVVSPALGNESFGIVLLEAMASGRALVAADIDGYRSVVAHGRNGLLVPPGDAATLAAAVECLLVDPALRARLGAEGRRTALAHDWRRIADRVEAVYRRAGGAPVGQPGRHALEPSGISATR